MADASTGEIPKARRRVPSWQGQRARARMSSAALYATLTMGAIILATPFLWLATSSLKDQAYIWLYPPQWIPSPVRWQNYIEAMNVHPFGLYFRNTLFLVVWSEVAIVGSASISGYGFAKYRFPGRELLLGVVLSTLMLPPIVLLIPQFVMFRYLGWIDTYLPLLVPLFFGGNPFYVFLFRQFFRTIPDELGEAARIDGCSEPGIYTRILLPLSKPVLVTVVIFVFIGTWNDFLGPLIFINSASRKTLALGLAHFMGYYGTQWHLLMAAATLVTLPILIIFFAAQKYFIQGIAFSGLKGA